MAARRTRNWPSIAGTEQERATEAFQRLEDLTRLISDWVWETDADGTIVYVSDRIVDRLGLAPVAVVGKHFDDIGNFTGRYEKSRRAPDFKRPFRDVGFDALAPDGRRCHFSLSGLPRFDKVTGDFLGATGIARDVTELVRTERANARLADAIEVLPEYFALYDEYDRLVISNARFRELNRQFGDAALPGGEYGELLRRQLAAKVYPAAAGNEELWFKNRMAHKEKGSARLELSMSSGRTFQMTEERLPDGGTVNMSRDVTDMKKVLETLRATAQEHRDFAAAVAHKLRTPLAVLRSNLDSLGRSEEVASLKREVDGLARLVEQLLTLTRYQNFTVPAGATVDLYAVTIDVISSLAPIAIKEGRALELEGAEGPIVVHGDAGAVEHAIRNLVENAIKYSARGTTVRIDLNAEPPMIKVTDEGRGIPVERQNELFQKFIEADRRGSGAGLGLTIVKAIADSHGANIGIADNPKGGTSFTLRFDQMDAIDHQHARL